MLGGNLCFFVEDLIIKCLFCVEIFISVEVFMVFAFSAEIKGKKISEIKGKESVRAFHLRFLREKKTESLLMYENPSFFPSLVF